MTSPDSTGGKAPAAGAVYPRSTLGLVIRKAFKEKLHTLTSLCSYD